MLAEPQGCPERSGIWRKWYAKRWPDEQAELIERLVSSGRYQNASEALREGLRLVESRESEEKIRLKALREAARLGIADAEVGRVHDFSSTTDLRAHLDSLARTAIGRARPR